MKNIDGRSLRQLAAHCHYAFGMVVAVVLLCGSLLPAQGAGQALPMWEIRSAASKGTVYLLGSVHVCRESCLRFSESVMRRFRESQALVLELDPRRPELASRMREAASLPPGQTLSSKLSPDESRRLQKVLTEVGVPMSAVDHLNPAIVSAQLSMLAAANAGLVMQYGIDVWFLDKAQAAGKPVRELETLDRQLSALFAGSPRAQIGSLMDTVEMIESRRLGPYLDELVNAWQAGDMQHLTQLVREGMGNGGELEQELIGKRNAEMAEKLGAWLARGEKLFVVVGAAHIAGPGSVASLLERKGLSVRQLRDGE